jgi:hypothetical protein
MARRTGKHSNEQLFCWEQIAKTNRFFRISHTFAPSIHGKMLLPLYALFSVVEEACSSFSDEELARSRLAWWRQECLGREPGPGSHPVIRELTRHARLSRREQQCITRLLDDAESRLDEAAPASLEELQRRCERVSRPQFELEMALCGAHGPDADRPGDGQGARMGLVQIMRESLRRRDPGAYWWLPLDNSARTLFAEILAHGQAWGDGLMPPDSGSPEQAGAVRHLQVLGALQAGLLRRLEASSPERFGVEVNRTTLGDLFRAWKTAQRVNRP